MDGHLSEPLFLGFVQGLLGPIFSGGPFLFGYLFKIPLLKRGCISKSSLVWYLSLADTYEACSCQRVRNDDIPQCNQCDEAFLPVKHLKKHKRVLRRIACSCQRIRNGLLCLHIELSSHPKTTTKVADMEAFTASVYTACKGGGEVKLWIRIWKSYHQYVYKPLCWIWEKCRSGGCRSLTTSMNTS